MAISSKSYIHKPLDYVNPVDLNLLGKVLQFKQAQYDTGVAKTQSNIDSLASMDIVKDVDREYLNAKINNLVSTVNNIGGADFSDPNVTNQIAGLSSQIYGDDKVVNAVANTKKFRYVQKYYTDLKEKKPKDWNPANEWYDMNKFSGWLSDGQVGTSADNGAGSVTPNTPYRENHMKMFEKIKGNMRTEFTDKGLMYRTDTYEYYTEEQVMNAAIKLLSPAEQRQLAIEGRYQYQGVPTSEILKAYDTNTYNRIAETVDKLNDYKAKLQGSVTLEDKEKYQKLVGDTERNLQVLSDPIQKNTDHMKESLYKQNYIKGLAERFAFERVSSKLQPATDKMFKLKYEQENQQFDIQQQNKRIDQMIEMADKGLMFAKDAFGNTTVVRDPNAPIKDKDGKITLPPIPGTSSSKEGEEQSYTEDYIIDTKTALVKENDKLYTDFAVEFARLNGITDPIITNLLKDGHLGTKVSPEMQKIIKTMKETWEAMGRGENVNYKKLDPSFKQFAQRYQQNTKEIEAYDNYLKKIDKQVNEEIKDPNQVIKLSDGTIISGENLKKIKKVPMTKLQGKSDLPYTDRYAYEYNGKTYDIGGSGLFDPKGNATKEDIKSLSDYFNKIEIVKDQRKQKRKEYIESSDIRINESNIPISDDKDKQVAKMIAGNVSTRQWYNSKGVAQGDAELNFENIEPQSKGYERLKAEDGKLVVQPVLTFKYKTGSGVNDYEIRKVILTPEQQSYFGFRSDYRPLTGYNVGLHLLGETNGIRTVSGKNYQIDYDLVKATLNQNDPTILVRLNINGNPVVLRYPHQSVREATEYMEKLTTFKDYEEFKFYIKQKQTEEK